MLEDLVVEGLGVIEHAEVHLSRGSTAITGETGAGKTLVVAALGLLRGGRADKTSIRTGTDRAIVEGRFTLPGDHPCAAKLMEYGVGDGAEAVTELVVSRSVSAQGSKARINGRLVTLSVLSEIVGELVEIAGQNEHQRLGDARYQRALLDRYAGQEALDLSAGVSAAVAEASEANRRGTALKEAERERSREMDVLRFETEEISEAGLAVGEWERLTIEAQRLENAETIASGLQETSSTLRDEGGAEDLLGRAESLLRSLTAHDPDLDPLAARLEQARLEINDVAAELVARSAEPDGERLAEIRDRLDRINKMKRKYGDDEQAVLTYLEEAGARLLELESAASDAEMWLERSQELFTQALTDAERLSELRKAAAAALESEIEERLVSLAMGNARFRVVLESRDLYPGGLEAVIFCASANSGEVPRPIAKAISGGELSRIALALHLACATESASTLVFDEVDAGVGGKAAQEIGRCLSALADRTGSQVIVVTHLPQVAAFADNHLRVSKVDDGAGTRALVEPIDISERVKELSRMLAGMPDSEGGRQHARELLSLAGRSTDGVEG